MPRLAVLGRPVSHSRSPVMQNAALAELDLAPEWGYEAIEVSAEGFEDLVRSLPRDDFAGVNVTVPHKLAALDVADGASAAAQAIGAANTLSFSGGRIEAENTDAVGLIAALPEPPAGARALVLGAGGAARACVWALAEAGAEVEIWNRTEARAGALAAEFGAVLARPRSGDSRLAIEGYELIVNATSVGLAEQPGKNLEQMRETMLKALRLDADSISASHTVVDLAYGPTPTPLAALAGERGAAVVDGLEVLVHQGAASLRIWTGLDPPIETMRRAARGG